MSTQFTNRQWRLPNNENKDKQSNYSMDFDSASSDYIDLGNITELNNLSAISTSSWFKTSNVSNAPIILNGGSSSTNRFYLQLYFVGSIRYVIGSSVENITVSNIADGNWHHISTVQNGTSLDIYLDGAKQNTSTITVVSPSTNIGDNFKIGRYFLSAANYFDGQIDAVSIFDYALTDGTGGTVNQIAALYGSSSTGIGNPMSLSPKPVASYNLGDKSAFNSANYLVPNIAAQEDDGDIATSFSPYALEFDGTNDLIDLGRPSSLNLMPSVDAFSISAWFKTTSSGTIYSFGAPSSPSNTQIKIVIRGNATPGPYYPEVTLKGTATTIGSSAYNDGNWHNIILTCTTSTATLYIDGSNVGSPTIGTATITSTDNGAIGARTAPTGGFFFNGSISNVSVWNAALTSAQVSEIYSEGIPQNLNNHSAYSNLVSWWQLGSNSSFNTNWTVLDEKGSNNGTSINMTEADIVDGVGSYANGLSSGMGGDEVVGDAPYSSSNALSVNMDVLDRVEDTPS